MVRKKWWGTKEEVTKRIWGEKWILVTFFKRRQISAPEWGCGGSGI
jgi:hypothetical protein